MNQKEKEKNVHELAKQLFLIEYQMRKPESCITVDKIAKTAWLKAAIFYDNKNHKSS